MQEKKHFFLYFLSEPGTLPEVFEIETAEEQTQLGRGHFDTAVGSVRRPVEGSFFEALGAYPQPAPIEEQNLDPVPPAIGENEEMTAERVGFEDP